MTRGAITAAVILVIALAACSDPPPDRSGSPKLIVLGVDGMDPNMLDRLMREGRMPNLSKLANEGTYSRLATSNPPQSPVAWSHFTTGARSDVHGIYDFVHRDPHGMAPYLSTSRTEAGDSLSVGSLALPTSGGSVELLRRGDSFWEVLAGGGVGATVVKIPANYPPPGGAPSEVLSGMGTPDLLGTYGTFQVLTDDPAVIERGDPNSGHIVALSAATEQTSSGSLVGPPDPLSAAGEALTLDAEVTVDRDRPVAVVTLGDRDVLLEVGEWSEWTPVAFDAGLVAGEVAGMVRLYLKSIRPTITVYVSPINLDPIDPAQPISTPESYAAGLARDAGRYYTQGMPEDTKALAAGVLTDDEFLAQEDLVFEERLRLLDRELDRFEGGVLFFYFSSIDLVSHMFWRALDPEASPEDARHADAIPGLYERIDRVVGDVRERHPDATLIVMSDHGFAPYRRKVHLNTWLEQRGYLALREGELGKGPLGHLDWTRTQAYALGLNQLFVNLESREHDGVVPAGERDILLSRIERELLRWRDPDSGARVVTRVYRPDPEAFPERAPDLLIGYNRGYRSADESAMGQLGPAVLVDNEDKWSGDHCMDPSHVPGVILSTEKLDLGDGPSLVDLAPTILSHFGVDPPPDMAGRSLWLASGGAQ